MKTILPLSVQVLAAMAAAGLLTQPASAVNLSNGNATAVIDTGAATGMHVWTVDGVDYLTTQWFWYRLGNTAEAPLNTLTFAGDTGAGPQNAILTYTSTALDVKISYTLTGGQPGSGVSGLGEEITLFNNTAQPLNLSFFQYSDYAFGGETVAVTTNLLGKYYFAEVASPLVAVSETLTSPGANRAEVAAVPVTLDRLNDGTATTLDNTVGPLSGDVSFAFQWDLTIAPNSSSQISKIKSLTVVPEPSTLFLAGLAGAAVFIFRRR